MPQISIIMPVYNVAGYLPEAIDSLSRQTCQDWELLCVDDGSTDNSLSILQEYAKKDTRIKVFSFAQNQGISAARNKALENANGEYITSLDGDDWYEPQNLELRLKAMTENDVDIVICGINIVEEQQDVLRTDANNYYSLKFSGYQKINEQIIYETNVVIWNKLYKRSIIDQYNIKFPPIREHDDDAFTRMYLAVSNSIYFLPELLCNYRKRENSLMTEYSKGQTTSFDRINTTHFVYDFLEKNKPLSKSLKIFYQIYRASFIYGYWKIVPEKRSELLEQEQQFITSHPQLHNLLKKDRLFKSILNKNQQKFERNLYNATKPSAFKQLKYKVLSHITFGKLRKKYKEKYKKAKGR